MPNDVLPEELAKEAEIVFVHDGGGEWRVPCPKCYEHQEDAECICEVKEYLAFAARCYREGAEQMRDVIMLAGVEIDGKDYIPWQDAERRSREFFEDEDTHAE